MSRDTNPGAGIKKIWIFVALFLALFLVRELDHSRRSSQTYDESFYIAYGSSLLNTWDFRLRKDKTSFIPLLSALPPALAGVEFPEKNEDWLRSDTRDLPKTGHWAGSGDKSHVWQFTLDFLYKNRVPPDTILFLARLPIILLSVLLAFFVFKWARGLYGDIPALIALGLYTNCPNILANSAIVTEDVALSLLMFLTVYFLKKYYESRLWRYLAFSGCAMGIALNTKYSAIILLPVAAAFAIFEAWSAGKRKPLAPLLELLALFTAAAAVLLLFYGFTDIREYFMGFRYAAQYIERGQMTFLAGNYSMTGFWNYFLYAFFLKTPVPLLAALGVLLLYGNISFKKPAAYREELYLLLLPAALFLAASFSPLQIGLRHILPIYPFLFVLCGAVYLAVKGRFRWILAALGLWYIVPSAAIHPHYLSYFNEFAGGPAGGHKYLLDSNLDWGQDLKELKGYLREEGVSDVVLSYFGSSSPGYLGMDFQDLFSFGIWGDKDHINSLSPKKEVLAISVTNLQGLYLSRLGPNIFFWLKEKRPSTVIGNTIHVYNITDDAAAHKRLASIYFVSGQLRQAERECERALKLEPGSPVARLILALNRLSGGAAEARALKELAALTDDAAAYESALGELPTIADTAQARAVYSETVYRAGAKLLGKGFLKAAERMLRTALMMDNKNLYAYLNLGALYDRRAEYRQALEIYSAAEALGLDAADLFYNKAVAFYQLGDPSNAKIYAGKALGKDPGLSQAKMLLSRLPPP